MPSEFGILPDSAMYNLKKTTKIFSAVKIRNIAYESRNVHVSSRPIRRADVRCIKNVGRMLEIVKLRQEFWFGTLMASGH